MPPKAVSVIVPSGANSATVQVLDANGADITGSCSIAAVSSDPTVVQIGSPDATTPNIIPFTAVGAPGSTATITYTATNPAGSVEEVDTLTVQVTAPASMVVTYGTTVPAAAKR
jgi:hypothetical protein